jgi:hypothetical protein
MRGILAQITNAWGATLIAAERTAWGTYAAAIAMKNRLGESIYLTGFNHFVRSNSIRLCSDKTLKTAAPTTLALPETDPTFSITCTTSTQKIAFSYSEALPWWAEEGAMMVFFMGQPQPATRNFFNGPWKKAGQAVTGIESPKEITAPFTIVAGQKIWAYARIARADGRLSEPMVAAIVAIA